MDLAAANKFFRLPGGEPCIWLKPCKSPWGSARLRIRLVDDIPCERKLLSWGPEKRLLARRGLNDCLRALMPAEALPEGLHTFVVRSKRNAALECPVASPASLSNALLLHKESAPRTRA